MKRFKAGDLVTNSNGEVFNIKEYVSDGLYQGNKMVAPFNLVWLEQENIKKLKERVN